MVSNVLLGLAFLVFVAANIQYSGLIVTVREHYPDYYDHVGKPPALFIGPLNAGAALSFLTYVTLGEFKDDNPPEQIIEALVLSRRLFLTTFALLILALVASFA